MANGNLNGWLRILAVIHAAVAGWLACCALQTRHDPIHSHSTAILQPFALAYFRTSRWPPFAAACMHVTAFHAQPWLAHA